MVEAREKVKGTWQYSSVHISVHNAAISLDQMISHSVI
jgi:hypothetical protein